MSCDGRAVLVSFLLMACGSPTREVHPKPGRARTVFEEPASILTGGGAVEAFGGALVLARDLDGDGLGDAAIAASASDGSGDGAVQVRLGTPDGLSEPLRTLSLSGSGVPDLAAAGDLDGDGLDDLAVGWESSSEGLTLRIHPGAEGGPAEDPAVVVVVESAASSPQGKDIAGLGDTNGDGYDDLGVAWFNSWDDKVDVLLGGASSFGSDATTVPAPAEAAGFGRLAGADVNGDGFADLAVGAPATVVEEDSWNDGVLYVFHGGPDGVATSYDDRVTPLGTEVSLAQFVDAAGDQDGDGTDEVLVALEDPTYEVGAELLYGGTDGTTSRRRDLEVEEGTCLGLPILRMVAGLGDLDGDGQPEYSWSTLVDESCAGRVYLHVADGTFEIAGPEVDGEFGTAMAGEADIDGDGLADLLISAPEASGGGEVLLYFGDPDLDGDGSPVAEDCDSVDPERYPGAVDLPDDRVDQDCDGHDASAPDTGDSAETSGPPDSGDSGALDDSVGAETGDRDTSGDADSSAGKVGGAGCAGACSAAPGSAGAALVVALALVLARARRQDA